MICPKCKREYPRGMVHTARLGGRFRYVNMCALCYSDYMWYNHGFVWVPVGIIAKAMFSDSKRLHLDWKQSTVTPKHKDECQIQFGIK